jgi:23S rRNA pseudouridine1911/1915/1917 synthase
MANLTILFEDNHCLAIAKPGGLLTQGVPPGIPTLESMAKDYLREKYQKSGNVYLGVPHRLDRPVSGVVLFARNSKAAARLAEQFHKRQVVKTYWAIVAGRILEQQATWTDWLRKLPEEARVEIAKPVDPGAKEAIVEATALSTDDDRSWLELRPLTGRSHQLRVQAAIRGHPILGDELYGSKTPFGPPAEQMRDRLIALHGRSLTFLHPIRYEPVTLVAPLPDYWPTPPFAPDHLTS